jgi:hypothetical protein
MLKLPALLRAVLSIKTRTHQSFSKDFVKKRQRKQNGGRFKKPEISFATISRAGEGAREPSVAQDDEFLKLRVI